MGIVGMPMWLIPDTLVSIFISDQATIEMARWPMRLVGLLMPIEALGLVLLNAVLGAGDAKFVMKISIGTQWLLFLPAAWFIGVVLDGSLLHIWIAQGAYRTLQTWLITRRWTGGEWSKIKV